MIYHSKCEDHFEFFTLVDGSLYVCQKVKTSWCIYYVVYLVHLICVRREQVGIAQCFTLPYIWGISFATQPTVRQHKHKNNYKSKERIRSKEENHNFKTFDCSQSKIFSKIFPFWFPIIQFNVFDTYKRVLGLHSRQIYCPSVS